MNKSVFIGVMLFLLGQALIWYQTNSQFFNEWARERPFLMAVMGLPISYILIYASKYTVLGTGGVLWPTRLIGFSIGMIVMTIFTYLHMNEGVNLKTGITLLLALAIVLIQLGWE